MQPLPGVSPGQNGVVVQLVRIHACHAWGRGFESRPFRREKKRLHVNVASFCFYNPGVLMKYPLYKNIQHFYEYQDDDDNFEAEAVTVLEQVFK